MSLLRKLFLTDPSDSTRTQVFDTAFKVPVVIDEADFKLHGGDTYNCFYFDGSLGVAGTLLLAFKTPATDRCHMTFDWSIKGQGRLSFYEGSTWTNQSGSLTAIQNVERNSSNTSGILEDSGQAAFTASDSMIVNPTGHSAGTALFHDWEWGARTGGSGGARQGQEWVLKANTQYVVEGYSSVASNALWMNLRWYEHTHG